MRLALRVLTTTVLTACAFATVPLAHASELTFSYTLDTGNVLSGVLVGTLLSDGNTFDVTSFSTLFVNGAAVTTPTTIYTPDVLYEKIEDTPAVSLNGLYQNLYVADNTDTFGLAAGDQLTILAGGNFEGATLGYGGNNFFNSDYNPADWSASIVGSTAATPEPSTFVFLGTGLLGLAGAARHKFFNF
jgi:PEP-CTERM motif